MKKLLIAVVLLASTHRLLAGGEHSGQVTFGELPVPGATVTATAGDKKLVTATDESGVFKLPEATPGVWTLKVEMLGFEPVTRDITVTTEPQPSAWTLALRPFDDITRGVPRPAPSSPQSSAASPSQNSNGRGAAPSNAAGRGSGFQRAGVTATPNAARPLPDEPAEPQQAQNAQDGFLINGSVNNGAASPFAQAAAFGNNRRGRGSLFNY